MRTKCLLAIAGLGIAMCLGASQGLAQDNQGGGGGGGGRGGRGGGGGGGNFDPAQFQERMMQGIRDRLEVTDDGEWKAIQPLVQKVMDARAASMSGMGRGMFGGGRQRGGPGGGGDNANNGGGNGGQRRGFPGTEPGPAAEALQKAIDAKASNAELKSAIAKYVEERKNKQADLEKAQADLRKVLSTRQEAIASLSGLL
jgi:hypothetical protein